MHDKCSALTVCCTAGELCSSLFADLLVVAAEAHQSVRWIWCRLLSLPGVVHSPMLDLHKCSWHGVHSMARVTWGVAFWYMKTDSITVATPTMNHGLGT